MDPMSCLFCQSPKITHICLDCVGPCLRLCGNCHKAHAAARHTLVDINLYQKSPSTYSLAEERECKMHTGKLLELVCVLCEMLLCYLCPYDENVTCENTPGGTGKHKTGLFKSAVASDKEKIDESLRTGIQLEDKVKADIVCLKKKKDDISTQHDQVKKSAIELKRTLISEAERVTQNTINKSEASRNTCITDIDRHLEDREHFLENLQRTREEAEGLKFSSSDVNLHRLTPSVVSRLTAPFNFPEPTIPTLKIELPTGVDVTGEMEKLAGQLITYIQGNRLPIDIENWVPLDSCTIGTPKGVALVEAFGEYGLFLTAPGHKRKKISADEVVHYGVCLSSDEKVVYSITQQTICMYTVEGENLKLMKEVTVEGALFLSDISSASSSTGNLAVLDTDARRITIHLPDTAFLRSLPVAHVVKDGCLWKLDWSSIGDHLYIAEVGKESEKRSVMKVKADSAEIVWRKPVVKFPYLIKHINGKLYISHNSGSGGRVAEITVMSPDVGSVIQTFHTPGYVGGIQKSLHADVQMVYYQLPG